MVAILIAFILLLLLLIQLPPTQNFIARSVIAGLNKEIPATLSVDRLYISFMNKVKVKGLVVTGPDQDTVISVSEINIGLKLFPLVRNEVRLGKIQVENPHLHLVKFRQDSLLNIVSMFQQEDRPEKEEGPASPPDIHFNQLRISNLNFEFADLVEGSSLSLELGKLLLQPEEFDLRRQTVQMRNLEFNDLYFKMAGPATEADEPARQVKEKEGSVVVADPLAALPWSVGIDRLELQNINADIRQQHAEERESIPTFTLQDLNADLSGIRLDSGAYAAEINSLEGVVNDQTNIRDVRMDLAVDNQRAVLRGGRILLKESRFYLDASLDYVSAISLISDPGTAGLQLHLRAEAKSKDLSDLLRAEWPLKEYPTLLLDARISGMLDSLKIDSISGTADKAIRLRISGGMNKAMDPDHLSGSLDLNELSIYREGLYALLPDSLLPGQLALPEKVSVVGNLAGNRSMATSNLSVRTTLGSVFAQVEAVMDTASEQENVQMNIYTDAFDLGSLLKKQDTLGQLAFAGQVQAASSGFKDPRVRANLNIARAEVLGYTYSDLIFTGDYSNELIHIQSSMDDPNSSFVITGEYHFNDSVPELFLEADLRQLRLEPLNFADSRADLAMKISAGWNGMDPKSMLGNLKVVGLGYESNDSRYELDSLELFLDGGTSYRMLLGNLRVNDTLVVHEIELLSEKKERGMDLAYSGRFENIPGTREGMIRMKGQGTLLTDPDSLVLVSDLRISNSSAQDTSGYRIDFSRILADQDRSSYDLSLAGNDLQLSGTARMERDGEQQVIEGQAQVDSLNLSLLQPFLADALQTISGIVSGNLTVAGPLDEPGVKGSLTFRNTLFNPKALNTTFTLENETVTLDNHIVSFDRLTLLDTQNNVAVLNGTVDLRREAENNFDLSLVANEFQLVDKSAAEGELYFGNVLADLDGKVTGTFESPFIQLNTAFRKQSDFSFVLPAGKTPTGEGIIQFVDAVDRDRMLTDSIAEIESIRATSTNLDIAASALITDRFVLTIITNPLTGERLQIRGDGDLGFSLDRSGAISLTGRYEISEGNYNLQLFDLIKREFRIEAGSYLDWSGEPLEANADIAAIYKVNTPLEELMQYQQGMAADGSYGSADFEVVMRLTGPLLTPELKFDIRSGEQGAAVNAALSSLRNNESELNKQVFSLLVLNRFMGESAAASDPVSYDFSNQSRQSLSSLLSKQLDRFADQYLDKVDLNIEIDSYETGTESNVAARTDVSMDLSTNVFNDRLTLEVGGSVAVEEPGTQGGNIEAGDLAGDFKVEYKLSKDGVYRVNVFNTTDYENEIDGEVMKTGVSFIFNKDFTTFRELFGGKKKGGRDED